MRCSACKSKGWLHAVSDERGPEIQRCDACMMFSSDQLAKLKHHKDCKNCTFLISPKDVLEELGRLAPSVNFKTTWTEDLSFKWDGDGPDPSDEYGMIAHDVDVEARVIMGGKIISGQDSLGGCYERPGERDADVHGYFLDMAHRALEELFDKLDVRSKNRLASEFKKANTYLKRIKKIRYDLETKRHAKCK